MQVVTVDGKDHGAEQKKSAKLFGVSKDKGDVIQGHCSGENSTDKYQLKQSQWSSEHL